MVNFIAMYFGVFLQYQKKGKHFFTQKIPDSKRFLSCQLFPQERLHSVAGTSNVFKRLKTQPLCSSSTGDEVRALCLPSVCCVPELCGQP